MHIFENTFVYGLLHDAFLPPLVAASAVLRELTALVERLNACLQITLIQSLIHLKNKIN